jgi:hypothetical protein
MKLGSLGYTYSTTLGAMTLQGPHQVAKQSRTRSESLTPTTLSQSALELRLCTPVSEASAMFAKNRDVMIG